MQSGESSRQTQKTWQALLSVLKQRFTQNFGVPSLETLLDGIDGDVEVVQSTRAKLKSPSSSNAYSFAQTIFSLLAQVDLKVGKLTSPLLKDSNGEDCDLSAQDLKELLSTQSGFWLTTKEAESIVSYLNPTKPGKISAKNLIRILENQDVQKFVAGYMVNNTSVYYAIFEGIEVV